MGGLFSAPKINMPASPTVTPPSLSDTIVREAGAAAAKSALLARGRSASFNTAHTGGAAAPVVDNATRSETPGLPWDYGLEEQGRSSGSAFRFAGGIARAIRQRAQGTY